MKELFLTVLKISLTTSAAVLAVFALSPFMERRYGARWKYYMWIALALRFALPFELNLPTRRLVITVPQVAGVPIAIGGGAGAQGAAQAAQRLPALTLLDIAALIWLAGCVFFLTAHIFSFAHYRHRILKNALAMEDAEILRQLRELSRELGLRGPVSAVKCAYSGSPMILGFLRPALVLPDSGLDAKELHFALKHELVHIKRADVFFKLLFVAANAVHWFNPLVWVMRKQANVDMELSCDERVVRGSDYAVRKAYTYTLLSTLRKQYNKGPALTTKFYGGKRIMKKRFMNILSRGAKRSGALFLACVLCLTAALGLVTGCSQTQQEAPPAPLPADDDPESFGAAPLAGGEHDMPAVATPSPADDSAEISRIVEAFAEAYYTDDVRTLKSLLTDPFEGEVYTHNGSGVWSDLKLKGLSEMGELELGTVLEVSLEHRDSEFEDMLVYMTIELVKQPDGWKISSYGLEA